MIRHGQPDWHHVSFTSLRQLEQLSLQYQTVSLSSRGRRAIRRMAQSLPEGFILSSDLPRARETAQILVQERKLPIMIDPTFREIQTPHIGGGLWGTLWGPTYMWLAIRCSCWIVGIGICSERPRTAWARVEKGAKIVLASLKTERAIILVSHGWYMTLLALFLRRHGLIECGPLVPNVHYGAVTRYCLKSTSASSRNVKADNWGARLE
jgi:broad specificity phosphatase PhoE